MKNFESEKTDIVSVILEDRDLLNSFIDALKLSKNPLEDSSVGFLQKIRCRVWSILKKVQALLNKDKI